MVTREDESTLHSAEVTDENRPRTIGRTVLKVEPHLPLEREPASHEIHRGGSAPTLLSSHRFVEHELIGRGGMGSVIRAFDKDLRRDVAIKVLGPESTTEADVARLTEEARIAGQLEHPHIVPVHEFGVDERGARFLCMKLVKGETLEDTLSWAGPSRLAPDFLADLLQIFMKVCDAVSFAHSRGILHRDLKPSNVMIGDFGQVYVLDWGVARSTGEPPDDATAVAFREPIDRFGAIGTPRYMAPEQLCGRYDRLDERTDVFALGATLYQILTGQPPHDPDSLSGIALRKARVTIASPDRIVNDGVVPPELSRIALKALAHDPADRYASVKELQRDIELFRRGAWHLPRVHFVAGSIIVSEGEVGDSAFIIVAGRCTAFGRDGGAEVTLREMGPGDVFGETAVFSNKPRSASVRALSDVVVMVVTHQELGEALSLNGWMGNFVKALSDRFRERDERLRELERSQRGLRALRRRPDV